MRCLCVSLIARGVDKRGHTGNTARAANVHPRTDGQRDFVTQWARAGRIGRDNLVVVGWNSNVDT